MSAMLSAGSSGTFSDKEEPRIVSQHEIVLRELHTFLNGATSMARIRNAEVARAAVYLLKTLPAARDAVLEHMYNLFDEAVNNFVLKLELEDNAAVAGNVVTDEIIVQEVHQVLSSFITNNPEAWAPIISTWSLDLLGYLSSKYADRRVVPHSSNLPEVLQLWMACRPTRTLIDLTTQCLSTLISSNPDTCIDALLETSVQHSPHFDWVVAHIGSCFPTTVITRVLACGLKDYCMHQDVNDDVAIGSGKKAPKMASVVGILGHLAAHHDDDIRSAVLALFQESFCKNPTREQLATVPFLLHLAAMSDMLSHVVSSEFVKVVTPDTLNKISSQVSQWKSAQIPGTEGLICLVVHLLLRSDGGGQVIRCLLDVTTKESSAQLDPGIHQAAGLILDYVLLEIQRRVHGGTVEIPLLHFMKLHISYLTSYLMDINSSKASWVLNLLKLICIHGGEKTSINVIGHLLCNVEKKEVSFHIKQLIEYIELSQQGILLKTFSHQMAELKAVRVQQPVILIRNIINLVSSGEYLKQSEESLLPSVEILAGQITFHDTEYSDALIELLSLSVNPERMTMSAIFRVCSSAVSFYFNILSLKQYNREKKIRMLKVVQDLLANTCQQLVAQHMVLRMLLEGVVDEKHALLFESKTPIMRTVNKSKHALSSLSGANRKYASSITLPQSHSSVFHAGVIGTGLRRPYHHPVLLKDESLFNKQIVLNTIQACCISSWRFPLDKTNLPSPSTLIAGMKIVALLMVELISPDVMFNGLPWPDEEFLKVTIERDLHIKRMFEDHPLLWDLLFLVATVHPSLCYCSVLLRAIMAVLLVHWSSCQEKLTTNSPKQLEVTQHLIDVMALGQLLPPPLSYIGEILHQLTPFETFCLLSDVWQYMRDNVPSPALFTFRDSESGRIWRTFTSTASSEEESDCKMCDKKYTDRLRYILLAKIEKFGTVYAKFFPA